VQSWDLTKIKAPEGTRSPAVLETVDGARAILILSPWPGEGHYPETRETSLN
jgi:hypothetical protein